MVFHWSLSDSKFPLVIRTLLSILPDLNNTEVWMDLTRPLITKSSNPCGNLWWLYRRAPITIRISFSFMFHSFFFFVSVLGLGSYLSFCFPSVLPDGQPERLTALLGSFFFPFFFFFLLLIITRSDRLAEVLYVCISSHYHYYNTPKEFCLIGWGCRIHWLHLCRGVELHPNECLR